MQRVPPFGTRGMVETVALGPPYSFAVQRKMILLFNLQETHRSEDAGVVADAHLQAVCARM